MPSDKIFSTAIIAEISPARGASVIDVKTIFSRVLFIGGSGVGLGVMS